MGQLPPSDTLSAPVQVGLARTIVAYRDESGAVPALDFLDGCDAKTKARYILKFTKMCDFGRLRGEDYHLLDAKKGVKEADGLSEFKDIASKSRILAMNDGKRARLVLLHGFGGKKEDRIKPQEILIADRRRQDYLSRSEREISQSNYGRQT